MLVSLTLSQAQNTQLQQDPSIKVLMYGAVDQGALTRTVRNEITFPNAIEIKIHGSGEIKGSALKGVKNKPGSIKPADLTPHLPKFGDKSASIQVFYGQTLIV